MTDQQLRELGKYIAEALNNKNFVLIIDDTDISIWHRITNLNPLTSVKFIEHYLKHIYSIGETNAN